jgi:lipopolysaccharide transport system permease protein
MLGIYTFVFQYVWQARWSGGASGSATASSGTQAEFALSVFVGLLMFDVFAQTVSASPMLIVQNANLVKRVVFPIEILPAAVLGSALAFSGIGGLVLLAGIAAVGPGVSWAWLLLPLIVLPLALLTLGVSWLVAAAGVFVRDTRPIILGAALPMLMFLTPVFYPLERVPEAIRPWLAWNPLAIFIESARAVLLHHAFPAWRPLAAATIGSVLIAGAGYAVFMKGRRAFADVL